MDGREQLFKFRWNMGLTAFLPLTGFAHGRGGLFLNQLKMRGVLPTHLLFLALAALRVYVFLQHEAWRVEAQLPLMVRDSHSFGQLLESQSYGREHVLWPSILYGLKTLGLDPVTLGPWLHLAFSILLLGIIFYGLPRLPLIVRVLAGSSYFLMYEYTAITRTYGLSALLLGIFLMLEMRSKGHMLWKALTLFLLALSSNIGLVLAIALAVYLFGKHSEERLKTRAIAVAVVAIGIVISIVTALPPADLAEADWIVAYRNGASAGLGLPHLLTASTRILLDGFLYFPPVTPPHWYEPSSWPFPQSLLSSGLLANNAATYSIGLAVIAAALWVLHRLFRISKPTAVAMAILWGGNLIVWTTMHPGYPRHFGLLVLGTLGLLALAQHTKSMAMLRWQNVAIGAILGILSISGFWAVYAEGRDDFSQSKNLAQWLQANYPEETPYVYPDHVGATISLYSGGYAYSLVPEEPNRVSFVRETEEFQKPFSIEMIDRVHLNGEAPLFITNFPFHAILDEGKTVVEPIQSFQPSAVPGESFWVHRIRPGIGGQPWTLKLLPFAGEYGMVGTSQSSTTRDFVDFQNWPEPRFDNQTGSTIEIKIKFLDAPKVDSNAFVLQLLDGKRPLQVSFFEDGFGIRHNVPIIQNGTNGIADTPDYYFPLRYIMDTTDDFHVYRFTLIGDIVEAYVDGKKVGASLITDNTEDKRVVFGTVGNTHENVTAQISYLAYSVGGAFPMEAETIDENRMWTLLTDMQTLFDVSPAIWPEAGAFAVRSAVDGVLTVGTRGADYGHFSRVEPELNNDVGSTAEVRLRLLEGPRSDINGAMFAILDGKREGKISFFTDHIKILDQNDIKAVHFMDTGDSFHTYRLVMVENTLRVYVDGDEVAAVSLSNQVEAKQIFFGDFSTEPGENMSAKVDYVAYSVKGAVGPDGVVIEEKNEQGPESWDTVKWGFIINTTGTETDPAGTGYAIDEFDNTKGSTAEVKLRILDAPTSGHDGAMFSLADGAREAKLSFFPDRIEIRDQNELKATHEMDTTGAFHVYRMALIKETLWVYVDGEEIAAVMLSHSVSDKKILFGDLSSEMAQNLHAQAEYLAYSAEGAMTPEGNAMPTAPVVDVIPGSPQKDDDLVARITMESIDPNGEAVSYSYAWYKDGVLQPQLTTDTVDSSNTDWDETWKCVATPNDGISDGPSAEDLVTIDTGIWTRFSGMHISPEADTTNPWQVAGEFETKSASAGILTIETSGNSTGVFTHPEERLDNAVGSTLVIKMKLLRGPDTAHDASMLYIHDGTRGGIVSFFNDRIEIRDGNVSEAIYTMDTSDRFHVYQLAIAKRNFEVYVDGKNIASVTLDNSVSNREIKFGDVNNTLGENFGAKIDYIAYSVKGAVTPWGEAVTPLSEPTAPVIDIIPESPQNNDDLVARITTESIDPNGDVVGYSWAWYRDGVLQPGLTTNAVASSNTKSGETWKCVVTPTDGILDGPPGEDQVTIDIGIWTKFSGMQVLPEAESTDPWSVGGTFDTRVVAGGILTFKTSGTNTGSLSQGNDGFDNAMGSTAEVKMQILDAPISGHDGAMFSLADGTREAKLSFFTDKIEIRDQNNLKATHEMDTTGTFHVYRMALTDDTLTVFVDGAEVATVMLTNQVTSKATLFGDFSSGADQNMNAQIEYLAYSTTGATAPLGRAVTPLDEPTAPVIDIIPESPQKNDDLVARITTESIDPNGESVSYSYAWYKNGVLQPQSTADTVDSSNTDWDETWKCVVTPNNGIVDGPPGEDQVTIDIGIWTKFSGMQVLPEADPTSPWGVGGTFDTRVVAGGILTFKTSGTNTGSLSQGNDGFDNAMGSTAEVKMRILDAPTSGFNGAMLSLMDGTREAKLSFFTDSIEIRDQNDFKAVYQMNTTAAMHVYRMALINDTLEVYVDGVAVATATLSNQISGKAVLFGDFSGETGQNMNAQIEYLAYSMKGAIAP